MSAAALDAPLVHLAGAQELSSAEKEAAADEIECCFDYTDYRDE
ncbi:hypothetical protein [Haloplanus vescus]|nr:hypothetical protein [Haloplanus vescus]